MCLPCASRSTTFEFDSYIFSQTKRIFFGIWSQIMFTNKGTNFIMWYQWERDRCWIFLCLRRWIGKLPRNLQSNIGEVRTPQQSSLPRSLYLYFKVSLVNFSISDEGGMRRGIDTEQWQWRSSGCFYLCFYWICMPKDYFSVWWRYQLNTNLFWQCANESV